MNATNPDSTSQPGAPALQPRFPFAILFFVWLLVIITTTLVTILLPESYTSTTRIKVDRNKYEMADGKMYDYPYDPYFIQTQFEIILSEVILGRVIEELKLNDEWGEKVWRHALEGVRKHNVIEVPAGPEAHPQHKPVRNKDV